MKFFMLRKRFVAFGVCLIAAGLIGAAVLGASGAQNQPPKGVKKPVVPTRQVQISEKQIQVLNQRKRIPFKKFDLAELQKKAGKPLTLDSKLTLPGNKQIVVRQYLDSLNRTEEKLNAYGYSLRNLPKGGVRLGLARRMDAATIKKQKDGIVRLHEKATSEKDRTRVKFARLAKLDAAQFTAAKKDHALVEQWRSQAKDKLLKKVNVAKLSAADRQLFNQISSPKAGTATLASLKKLAASASDPTVVQLVETVTANSKKTWPWSYGDPDLVEVYAQGSLETKGEYSWWRGTELLETRGRVDAGFYVFDGDRQNPYKMLEVASDLKSVQGGTRFQLSAKVFGNDLFSPIDETQKDGSFKFVDQTYPWDLPIDNGSLDLFGISLRYSIHTKGNVHVRMGGLATPSHVTTWAPSVSIASSLYPTASLGAGLFDHDVFRVGARGNVNLVDEELQLGADAGVIFQKSMGTGLKVAASPSLPYLEIDDYAWERLKLLGGSIEVFAEVWFFGWHELGSLTLFSWDDWVPVAGYLFADETKIPLQ